MGNTFNSAANNVLNLGSNTNTSANSSGSMGAVIGWFIFIALLGTIAGVVYYFKDQITDLWQKIKEMAQPGANLPPPVPEEEKDENGNLIQHMEKVLPGGDEVFNVSSNRYTYYDASPLCKALGAELATYEQVKKAFEKGADWCNYGWVQGQMAVYPTSEQTYAKLQQGPEDQRMACGRPGVNGGYFDNPEMRFGVTCYGKKPPKSKHDDEAMNKGVPISPDALAFDKKVNQYKSEADSIGINPFNSSRW